jgi:hypothetical protein
MTTSKSDRPVPPLPVRGNKGTGNFWWFAVLLTLCMLLLFFPNSTEYSRVDYSFFLDQLERENIKRLTVYP